MYDIEYTRQVTESLKTLDTFEELKCKLVYATRLKNEIDRAGRCGLRSQPERTRAAEGAGCSTARAVVAACCGA